MNSEEQNLLTQFLDQLKSIRGMAKDPEADRLIARAAAEQPDALYLLVQKALLQEQGLKSAQTRIEQLQQQLSQAQAARSQTPAGGGFLGQNPWANPAPRAAGGMGYAPTAPLNAPPMGMGMGSSGFGSFLGSAAATAAGVAAGAFLFQGIENLMGHHDHGGGAFSDTAADEGPQAPENVTINQYYGDDAGFQNQGGGDNYGENTPIADDDWESYDDDVNSVDV